MSTHHAPGRIGRQYLTSRLDVLLAVGVATDCSSGRHMGVESSRLRRARKRWRAGSIMPPMPWPAHRDVTDEDLHAIWAYLRTVPAISNGAPRPAPPGEGAASAPH